MLELPALVVAAELVPAIMSDETPMLHNIAEILCELDDSADLFIVDAIHAQSPKSRKIVADILLH